mmetsp:Transcript_25625/g.36126  ORF Transcript_25625/g.36126 Transcript_25625/m.36126 type:complete len:356 (+) Transcript_25625:133-1200(+)
MADLHNLLGELEDQEEESSFIDVNATNEEVSQPPQSSSPAEADNTDIENDEVLERTSRAEVPPALAEAERKQHHQPVVDGEQGEEDDDLLMEPTRNVDDFASSLLKKKQHTSVGDGDEDIDETMLGALEDEDYAHLKTLWKQEVNCPELLGHDTETIDLFMELLQGQEESIDKLLDQSSASNSRKRHSSRSVDRNLASLVASIYKMDADRVRFMLTDLARTRLSKIEQHALFMRSMVDRMSEEEISYLKQYGELLERHLRRTVLDHFPKEAWKKLDEPEMIDSPDLDEFVFCKVLETVEIDNRDSQAAPHTQDDDDDDDDLGEDSIQEHAKGSCLIARYSAIQDLVHQGKIELLM